MLRGINRQQIFEEDEDYERFIHTLEDYKFKCGYQVYAYCFMRNHMHLLIKEGKEDLGLVFKRIGASYVYWYNLKYKRCGHLFQDRYKSEPVENDEYFLTVLRYIHQNPLKAGIEKDIAKYRWSSYKEYIGRKKICDTKFALELFSTDAANAIPLFEKYNKQENNDRCLEYEEKVKINDKEAAEIVKEIANISSLSEIQSFEKAKRNEVIKRLKAEGLSIRQIERLTGIAFGVIRGI